MHAKRAAHHEVVVELASGVLNLDSALCVFGFGVWILSSSCVACVLTLIVICAYIIVYKLIELKLLLNL